MNASDEFRAREVHTRFLYPFLFARGEAAAVAARLQTLEAPIKGDQRPVWQPVRQLKAQDEAGTADQRAASGAAALYTDELLCPVREFLFPRPGADGCRYLQADPQLVQSWFHNRVLVRHRDAVLFSALLDRPQIEVFLSPYGAGLLSLALCTPRPRDADDITLEEVKHFNYRLAQLRRPGTVPTLSIPHPWDTPESRAKAGDRVAPPPAPDAPLGARLGVAGGGFTLVELAGFLLGPVVGRLGFAPTQEQFSVYTVVRFDRQVDFADPEARGRLGPLLAGLAQVEEPAHAGALPGEPLDVPNRVMNASQWVAAGSMGLAHLVADQHTPPSGFDEQRVPQYRDKYFIPYLLALLQRLTLQRGVEDAARAVRSPEHRKREDFRRLHGDLLDFAVAGHFTEVSSRHAINGFYRLAQQGLGVDRALGIVTQAVQSQEARQIADDLSANVRTVSQVQRKVEWLEVFFVSFYATELANLIAEKHFAHDYGRWGVLAAPLLGGLVAMMGLRPWRVHHAGRESWWSILARFGMFAIAATAVGWWLWIGFTVYRVHGLSASGRSLTWNSPVGWIGRAARGRGLCMEPRRTVSTEPQSRRYGGCASLIHPRARN